MIDQLQAWLTKTLPQVAPKTKLGQVLQNLQAQWPTLVRYLDDDRYPIETAKGHGIEPYAYLRHNFRATVLSTEIIVENADLVG